MKTLHLLTVFLFAVVSGSAADASFIQSLVNREFVIHDDFAGQELAFKQHGESVRAVWRILGSGVAVISEVESPIEIQSPRQCVFDVQLRDKSRSKVKVELREKADVRIYVNGVRIEVEEKKPNQSSQRNASTGSVSNLESPARRG